MEMELPGVVAVEYLAVVETLSVKTVAKMVGEVGGRSVSFCSGTGVAVVVPTGGAGGGNRGGGGIQEVKSFIALAASVGVGGAKSGGGGGGLAWLLLGIGGQWSGGGDGDGATCANGAMDSTLPLISTVCKRGAAFTLSACAKATSGSSAILRPLFLAQRA